MNNPADLENPINAAATVPSEVAGPANVSSKSGDKKTKTGVAAVQHAMEILLALDARNPEFGVNELARRAGVHKSTASRILSTLESARFVARDPDTNRFRIGMGLIALVNPIVGDMDVVKLARPYIDNLARETGETTSLGFWLDGEVIMVEQVPGSRAVGFLARASTRVPAYCTASGKVFLAYMSPQERHAYFDKTLEKVTPFTKTTEAELQDDFNHTRDAGFARNSEEYQAESCGLASMIWDASGTPVAALTIAMPKHRFTPENEETLSKMLMDATQELSRSLGHIASRF